MTPRTPTQTEDSAKSEEFDAADLNDSPIQTIEDLHARDLMMFEIASKAGNITATLDALLYCRQRKVGAPGWLLEAAFDLAVSAIVGEDRKKGPGGNHLARYRQDLKHLVRHYTVEEVRSQQKEVAKNIRWAETRQKPDLAYLVDRRAMRAAIGKSVEHARIAASKLLAGTAAAGGEEAIASSCKKMRSAPPGRYKLPDERVLDKLGLAIPTTQKGVYEALGLPLPK